MILIKINRDNIYLFEICTKFKMYIWIMYTCFIDNEKL